MSIVLTIIGAFLILLGLWDMFHSLLHPRGRGSVSHAILQGVWALSRSLHHRFGSAAGPAGMVVVTILWVLFQVVGWALIYLPHIPGGFSYGPGVDPARYPDLMQALVVSAVTLSTLGFGDVVPVQPALRMLAPVQALTGFALLTGALSWFTQAFPPLSRRRALAMDIDGLSKAEFVGAIENLDPITVTMTVSSLSSQVSQSVVDLVQYSESYYFLEVNPQTSLAHQVGYLLDVRDAAARSSDVGVRMASNQLGSALESLSTELGQQFLSVDDSPSEVFRAYARDHGYGDDSNTAP